jgi:cytochrome c556
MYAGSLPSEEPQKTQTPISLCIVLSRLNAEDSTIRIARKWFETMQEVCVETVTPGRAEIGGTWLYSSQRLPSVKKKTPGGLEGFQMKHWLIGAAVVVCAGAAWAADAPQKIVDARVAGMKGMVADLTAATKAATTDEAKAKLTSARKFAETIATAFPKGTGIGDAGVTKSRALQDIWAKPTEFKAAADALVVALKAAEAAVGDKAKLDAAFGEVRKSCGGCHTPFRGPETE